MQSNTDLQGLGHLFAYKQAHCIQFMLCMHDLSNKCLRLSLHNVGMQSHMNLQRLGSFFAYNEELPLRPNSEPKLDSPYTSSVLTLMKRLILP